MELDFLVTVKTPENLRPAIADNLRRIIIYLISEALRRFCGSFGYTLEIVISAGSIVVDEGSPLAIEFEKHRRDQSK